jgi:ornithine carbamoyltransferase
MKIQRLLTIQDLSSSEIKNILLMADALENKRKEVGSLPALLRGKVLGMIFDEPSLRTRSAFERGIVDLGGQAINYGAEARIGRNAKKQENLKDFVNVAGRFTDVLLSRIYNFDTQSQIAALSPVPFINGMCDLHHPTQALCDFLTLYRQFGQLENLKIAFVGDGTNIALSLAQTASKLGATFTCATPPSMALPNEMTKGLKNFHQFEDPFEAVSDAHAVVADAWIPMNLDHEAEQRRKVLEKYRVTPELMKNAKSDAVFLHNLPAYRGNEVVSEVIDGPQSLIYDEAVSRLHIARALLLAMLSDDWDTAVSSILVAPGKEKKFDYQLDQLIN